MSYTNIYLHIYVLTYTKYKTCDKQTTDLQIFISTIGQHRMNNLVVAN